LQLPQNSIRLAADTDQDFQPSKGMTPHAGYEDPVAQICSRLSLITVNNPRPLKSAKRFHAQHPVAASYGNGHSPPEREHLL